MTPTECGDLIERLKAAEGLSFIARRELEGEIHCLLTGLPTCDVRYGDRRHCANAWPAECRSENDRWGDGTYYCGVGRIGGQKRDGDKWVYVPSAPEYAKTDESRRETLATLEALRTHKGEGNPTP